MNRENIPTLAVKPPLSETILQSLRKHIQLLTEGERLPTVRELMKKFGVSQLSVQTALDRLKLEGLITAHVGRGTFVARQPAPVDEMLTSVTIVRYDYPSRRGEEITRALHASLQAEQFRVLTVTCGEQGHAMEVLRDAPVADGYILQPLTPNVPVKMLEFLQRRSRAVVIEGYPTGGVDVDAVATDELACIDIAVRHLMELGHRRIGFAAGEPVAMDSEVLRYFPMVMRWAGLESRDAILLAGTKLGASSFEGMRTFFTSYLQQHERLPFTAMLVGGYASALGLLAALRAAGKSAPQDLSLVVIDNTDLEATSDIHLTTVGRSSQRIAADLLKRLQYRLNNQAEPHGTAYELPELVVRASTSAISA